MNDSEGEYYSRFRGSPGVDRISISVSGTINRNEPENPSNQGQKEKPVSDETRREIGDEGVWSLSSTKLGNGIEQLRDDNISTFWQSDDIQPHFILIEFPKKKRVSEIWLYLDYKTDESYTPSKIAIRIENSFNEMVEIKTVDYDEPVGWYQISLEEKNVTNVQDNTEKAHKEITKTEFRSKKRKKNLFKLWCFILILFLIIIFYVSEEVLEW